MNHRILQIIILVLALFTFTTACGQEPSTEILIRNSVQHQMEKYPKSTLRDLYKNFFQDYFGPGHIIRDTATAGRYLREESALCLSNNSFYIEPTGYLGNYYRVDLSLIAQKIVPYETFFNAFVQSANRQPQLSIDHWKKEWFLIDQIIESMNLHLAHYQQDRDEIFALLKQDKYVLHHSSIFNQTYHLHYRIIAKDLFEKELLPLLQPK